MIVVRKELLEILDRVQPALASKEVIEQTQSFVFMGGRVYTYNDEIAISAPIPFELEGAVHSEQLHGLLRASRTKQIDIETTENELIVSTKRSKAGISLESEQKLPLDELGEPDNWKKIPKNFCEGLKFCAFSASKDMSKRRLTCLHVKGTTVTSCDNFRFTQFDLESKCRLELLIPMRAVQELIKYNPTRCATTDGWLHFKSKGDVTFSCRTYEDKYPDISHFLEVDGPTLKFPKRIERMTECARVFTKTVFTQDEQVTITIKKGELVIEARGPGGWFEERTKMAYKGKSVSFIVHPGFFMECVALLRSVTIGENRLRLTGEGFLHVVSLCVPKDEEGE